jgi:hypothetical protein
VEKREADDLSKIKGGAIVLSKYLCSKYLSVATPPQKGPFSGPASSNFRSCNILETFEIILNFRIRGALPFDRLSTGTPRVRISADADSGKPFAAASLNSALPIPFAMESQK